MRTLAVLFVLTSAAVAAAQEDLHVLRPDDGQKKMLYNYLEGQARKHFEARRQAVGLLKSPDDVRRRQEDLKAKFIDALGGLPERTPLNAQVIGKDMREGYSVERIIYESRPSHHVTALFYLPEGKGPFPGVLIPCGHDATAKSADSNQRAAILLAKNGIAALCYDPIGQGERIQALDALGKPAIGNSTSEHTLVSVGGLPVGRCTASYRIWDGMRSLDYLAGRPEIDPKHLGCTGCSGGGTLTSYLMALDDRILAAAPSCYITSLERLFATLGPQDGEQNLPGQVAFGMEQADYLTLRAPKPTLILCASRDFFDQQGTWTTYREAKRIYGLFGHGESVDIAEFDTPHGYPKPQREAMVRFMRRWLLGKDEPVTEPDFTVAKDADLHCTRTGQVLEDLKGRSVFDLNAERMKELAGDRAKFAERPAEDRLKEVRRLLALPERIPAAKLLTDRSEIRRDGYTIYRKSFETEPGIVVPVLWFQPEKEANNETILYISSRGKATDAAVGGPIEKLVKEGHRVIALDLRGWGETAPSDPPANKADYWGPDWKEAFLGLHLGRPLLGQRVHDLLSMVEYLSARPERGSTKYRVIGIGAAGPVVLHAAALHPDLTAVELHKATLSWSSVVRTPGSHAQLASMVPGTLKAYDLPDLAGLVAPRPLTIRTPVDAANKAVSQEELDEAYAACKKAYGEKKAEKALTLKAVE